MVNKCFKVSWSAADVEWRWPHDMEFMLRLFEEKPKKKGGYIDHHNCHRMRFNLFYVLLKKNQRRKFMSHFIEEKSMVTVQGIKSNVAEIHDISCWTSSNHKYILEHNMQTSPPPPSQSGLLGNKLEINYEINLEKIIYRNIFQQFFFLRMFWNGICSIFHQSLIK